MALVCTRQGTHEYTPSGFAPLPTIRGQYCSSRREVAWSTDDIAGYPGFLQLAEGKAPIADEGFVGGQLDTGLLEQAHLQVGFAGIGGLAPDEEARDCQTLCPHCPHTRRKAQGDSGQSLPGCGRVVLGRAVPQPWPEEPDEVTGDRTIPAMLVSLKDLFMLDKLLPGRQ